MYFNSSVDVAKPTLKLLEMLSECVGLSCFCGNIALRQNLQDLSTGCLTVGCNRQEKISKGSL